MVSTNSPYYREYLAKKQQLESLIEQQMDVLSSLEMMAWQRDVEKLRARVQQDNFKVFVMGEFKRGKSTFINALLGEKVLPAYAIPCTAIINEVKWGNQPRAILHHLPSPDGLVAPPRDIPVTDIDQYVVIKESKPGHFGGTEVVYTNPYEKVELFWPLDICHDGVECIDSPGLNEDIQRQEITLEYLKTVDVVLFVIACDFPVARSETQVIEMIKDAGHEYIFFICNRINMIAPEEQGMVMNRCISMLAPSTKEGERNVFFINARGALEARRAGDIVQLEQSNVPVLEEKLKTFLATQRGRIKLLRPALELRGSIREAERTLPDREKLMHIDLSKIQERYTKATEELRQLEDIRNQIYHRLMNFRTETRQIVFDAASRFYTDAADQVESWVESYEIQTKIKIYEVLSQSARERVVEEVTAYLTGQVKSQYDSWKTATFEPLLEGRLANLGRELDEKTKQFVDNLEQVRVDLVADSLNISTEAANQERVTILSRILGVAGGFLIGDISSMALGAVFGFNEMLKSLLPQMAIAVAVVAIVGWNPIILIPALLFGGGIQAFIRNNSINKKIRDAVGKEYAQKLRENRADLAGKIADAVDKKLEDIQSALSRGLGLELQNVRDQAESIIRLKQQEQSKVDQAILELKAIQSKLHAIDGEVDDFIKNVALASALS